MRRTASRQASSQSPGRAANLRRRVSAPSRRRRPTSARARRRRARAASARRRRRRPCLGGGPRASRARSREEGPRKFMEDQPARCGQAARPFDEADEHPRGTRAAVRRPREADAARSGSHFMDHDEADDLGAPRGQHDREEPGVQEGREAVARADSAGRGVQVPLRSRVRLARARRRDIPLAARRARRPGDVDARGGVARLQLHEGQSRTGSSGLGKTAVQIGDGDGEGRGARPAQRALRADLAEGERLDRDAATRRRTANYNERLRPHDRRSPPSSARRRGADAQGARAPSARALRRGAQEGGARARSRDDRTG